MPKEKKETFYRKYNNLESLTHYERHIHALTDEKLFMKSEVAAELAYRDQVIDKLMDGDTVAVAVANCWDDERNALLEENAKLRAALMRTPVQPH